MRKLSLLLMLMLFLVGCNALHKIEQTQELMGTQVTITIYSEDKELASNAISAAFSEISRIDSLLSNYNNKSEVYMFNEQGHIENPSDEMVKNINAALYYGNISNGSFDITVQPILDLYTYSFQELRRPPTSEEIDSALILVDYNDIFIKKNLILFRKEGMKITLGGITKGYAIDKAIEVLEDRGIEHALVNAGGDMRVIGSKPDGKWKIALQNPRDEKDFITIIDLDNVAVATSGDYERYFNENKSFHHIVDPRTGYSATSLMSVTIIASKAMDADAIATSVFVLGKEKGLELIESLNDVEGLVITEEKEIVKSSDFNY